MKNMITDKNNEYKHNNDVNKSRRSRSARIRRRRRKRKNRVLNRLLLIIFIIMICIGVGGLVFYWYHISAENNKLEALSQKIGNTLELDISDDSGNSMLSKYAQIYNENSDLFGWIQVEDTPIDYPVMQTPEDPEKYLRTNFEGEYSHIGLPFLEEDCTKDSDNLVIYAHNMKDGSMFRTLFKYEDKDYWEKHPIIKFDTLYEEKEYEILSVFYDRVYYKYEDVFKFYQFIDAEDEADYENAISNFKKKQIYDTGVDAEYGDQLITLVTCSYHEDNGRFVVVAREK